jgi:hypothetical protein
MLTVLNASNRAIHYMHVETTNKHHTQVAKNKSGTSRVVDIVWQYPAMPNHLPQQLYDKVYKDDPPSANSTKPITINLTPGSLRKYSATSSNSNTAQACINAIMGLPSSSNATMPNMSNLFNTTGNIAPQMNNMPMNMILQSVMQLMQQVQQGTQAQRVGGGGGGGLRLYGSPGTIPGCAFSPSSQQQDRSLVEPPRRQPLPAPLPAPPAVGSQLQAMRSADDADDDGSASDLEPEAQANIMAIAAAAAAAKGKAKAKAGPKAKAKSAQRRPAAARTVLRRPAAAGVRSWTLERRVAERPTGCTKCRFKRPGCCASCWGARW